MRRLTLVMPGKIKNILCVLALTGSFGMVSAVPVSAIDWSDVKALAEALAEGNPSAQEYYKDHPDVLRTPGIIDTDSSGTSGGNTSGIYTSGGGFAGGISGNSGTSTVKPDPTRPDSYYVKNKDGSYDKYDYSTGQKIETGSNIDDKTYESSQKAKNDYDSWLRSETDTRVQEGTDLVGDISQGDWSGVAKDIQGAYEKGDLDNSIAWNAAGQDIASQQLGKVLGINLPNIFDKDWNVSPDTAYSIIGSKFNQLAAKNGTLQKIASIAALAMGIKVKDPATQKALQEIFGEQAKMRAQELYGLSLQAKNMGAISPEAFNKITTALQRYDDNVNRMKAQYGDLSVITDANGLKYYKTVGLDGSTQYQFLDMESYVDANVAQIADDASITGYLADGTPVYASSMEDYVRASAVNNSFLKKKSIEAAQIIQIDHAMIKKLTDADVYYQNLAAEAGEKAGTVSLQEIQQLRQGIANKLAYYNSDIEHQIGTLNAFNTLVQQQDKENLQMRKNAMIASYNASGIEAGKRAHTFGQGGGMNIGDWVLGKE